VKNGKRKNYTAKEKVGILRRHFVEQVPVSELCNQYGIHPTMFYRWQQILFENGTLAFERTSKSREDAQSRKIAALEAKLQKKDEVVAELLEEHVTLKKTLGGL